MLAVLKRIQEGIDGVETVLEPKDPVAEGEEVIGEITDPELKRFYSFRCGLIDIINEKIRALEEAKNAYPKHQIQDENCPFCSIFLDIRIKESFLNVVSKVFCHSINLSLGVKEAKKAFSLDTGNFGFREGWKVVLLPKRENHMTVIDIVFPL